MYLVHEQATQALRRERELAHAHIATVRDLHVLSVVSRNAPLHVDQVPLRIDLVHLRLNSHLLSHQQVLHRAVLVAHPSRHLLPLERLAGVLRLTLRLHRHLTLTRRTQRAVRHAHAVRGTQASEVPTTHHTLESLALAMRRGEREHLRHTLNVDSLSRNEVSARDFGAYTDVSMHSILLEMNDGSIAWDSGEAPFRPIGYNSSRVGSDILLYYATFVVET